jgi:hypothetical protein
VAKIDIEITHPGISLLPKVNEEEVLFFLKKELPKSVIPTR